MATTVRLHQHTALESTGPDDEITVLPHDQEFIEEGGIEDNKICVTRQCFLLVDRHNQSRLQGDLDSLHWRLFDGGSPIHRSGLTYSINCELIAQNLKEITQVVRRDLSDKRNSGMRTLLFCVVSIHIISLPEETDEGDDEYDEEEAWMIEDEEFITHPASREAVISLGRTRVKGGDCAICLEELSYVAEHVTMPCRHIFHEECIVKWLEISHSCPLCRFSLPQVGWNR